MAQTSPTGVGTTTIWQVSVDSTSGEEVCPSVPSSVCLCPCQFTVHLCIYLTIHSFMYLFIYLFIYYLSIYQFIYLFIYLFTYLFMYVYLNKCVMIILSINLTYLHLCLYILPDYSYWFSPFITFYFYSVLYVTNSRCINLIHKHLIPLTGWWGWNASIHHSELQ